MLTAHVMEFGIQVDVPKTRAVADSAKELPVVNITKAVSYTHLDVYKRQHRWWPLSPALLILIFPLGFRVTCYYYRKACLLYTSRCV